MHSRKRVKQNYLRQHAPAILEKPLALPSRHTISRAETRKDSDAIASFANAPKGPNKFLTISV